MTHPDFKSDRDTFQQLFDASPDPAWIISNNEFVECNEAAVRTLGYSSRKELLNLHPSKLSPPFQPDGQDSFAKAEHMMAIARDQGLHRFEWLHTKADGTNFVAEVTLSAVDIDNRQVIYCVWRDVTESKRVEAALKEREQQFLSLSTMSSDWFWSQDEECRFTGFHGAFASDFTPPSNSLGKTRWELNIDLPPEQWAAHRAIVNAHLPFRNLEYPISDDHGEVRWYSINGDPRFDESGRFTGYHGTGRNITELKQSEERLRESEERYRTAFLTSPDAINITRVSDGLYLEVSDGFVRMTGWTREETVGRTSLEMNLWHHPGDRERLVAALQRDGYCENLEAQFVTKDGRVITGLMSAHTLELKGQQCLLSVTRDITARKAAEDELRKLSQAVEQSSESIVITDTDARIEYVNEAFVRNTGYSREEAIGKNPRILQSGKTPSETYTTLWNTITQGRSWRGELHNRRKDGSEYTELAVLSPIRSANGNITHFVAVKTDITDQKAAAELIQNLAFYSPLTHLPNRRLLLDRLKHALDATARHQSQGALLLIDLDDFKTLNDTLGHDQGDALLRQVSERLLGCLRKSDTVAHLGGDEFVVLLEDLGRDAEEVATQAKVMGEKIIAALNQPYVLGGGAHRNTASVGVTLFNGIQAEGTEEPLKQAELAMYQAKAAGRNTLRFFDPQMQAVVSARATLETRLREAVAQQQFVLHYQPQIDDSHQITGVEALVRWRDPHRGMVSPTEFIPLAEETGLILPLGQWVLETACTQLARWARQPAMAHLTMAVNVSARQLHQSDFFDQVMDTLRRTGARAHRLKLELTESMLVNDIEDVIAKMGALKGRGVAFSLDDFGTGYSSLSHLKRLPLDQLKIDQSFVRNILDDPNDAAIAKTVIALAESMGLAVIAEGVETEAQRDFLADLGCQAYQGYLFSQPLSLEQFEALLQRA